VSAPLVVRDAAVEEVPALERVFRRASLSNPEDRENLLAHPEALEFASTALADGRVRVATDQSGRVLGFATTAVDDRHLELSTSSSTQTGRDDESAAHCSPTPLALQRRLALGASR
jgi:hypothetical protein